MPRILAKNASETLSSWYYWTNIVGQLDLSDIQIALAHANAYQYLAAGKVHAQARVPNFGTFFTRMHNFNV